VRSLTRRIHQSVLILGALLHKSAANKADEKCSCRSRFPISAAHDPLNKRDLRPPIVLMEPFWRGDGGVVAQREGVGRARGCSLGWLTAGWLAPKQALTCVQQSFRHPSGRTAVETLHDDASIRHRERQRESKRSNEVISLVDGQPCCCCRRRCVYICALGVAAARRCRVGAGDVA
jgi:hypothetical protein